MPIVKVDALVLEDKSGSFKNDSGESVSYAAFLAQAGDRVMKFKAAKDVVVKDYVNQNVSLTLEVRPGKDLLASVICTAID